MGLPKSIGGDYQAISLQLGGGFSGWMRHQERPTGIPDDLACLREYSRYLLKEVTDEPKPRLLRTTRKTIWPFIAA